MVRTLQSGKSAIASATDLPDELSRVRIEAERSRRELSRAREDFCDSVRASYVHKSTRAECEAPCDR